MTSVCWLLIRLDLIFRGLDLVVVVNDGCHDGGSLMVIKFRLDLKLSNG